MLLETWRDQFDRMMRSHAALECVNAGSEGGSTAARDVLYHFVQDAWHLKDWLKSDPAASAIKADVDRFVESVDALRDCQALCNATKHLRTKGTEFVSQSVRVDLGQGMVSHAWTYKTSSGVERDAAALADEAVQAWTDWLAGKGML